MKSAETLARAASLALTLALGLAAGCSDGEPGATPAPDLGGAQEGDLGPGPWPAAEVLEFHAGAGAGFGQDALPDVVLDLPEGAPDLPSEDVVSLGNGGEIVLGLGALELVDGPGPDLQVFENVFLSGSAENPYAEVAALSLSADGQEWRTFPVDYRPAGDTVVARFVGFAGLRPGGDLFDLADLGLPTARYLRLRDAGSAGPPDTRLLDAEGEFLDDPGNLCCGGPSQGFDLDGVALLHARRRE